MTAREKLIVTAARLFQKKGYNATGINEILAESQAPKGSLYYYFPEGKLQLAMEAVRYSGNLVNAQVARRLAEEADAVKAFHLILSDMIDRFATVEPPFEDVSLSIIALEAADGAESLRLACEEVLDERERIFVGKLAACGYEASEAGRLGRLLQILIEGAVTAAKTRDSASPLAAVSDYLPTLLAPGEAAASDD
jgi:TetR/AcrR family transcriptional repressor of lmrAB and yxaGH operons